MDDPHAGYIIRVFIVEDHPVTQEGLQALIAAADHLECCGTAAGVGDARHLVSILDPDVILLDLALGDEDGEDLLDELDDLQDRVVVYSMFDLDRLGRVDLLDKFPFVSKTQQPSDLVAAIRKVWQLQTGTAA